MQEACRFQVRDSKRVRTRRRGHRAIRATAPCSSSGAAPDAIRRSGHAPGRGRDSCSYNRRASPAAGPATVRHERSAAGSESSRASARNARGRSEWHRPATTGHTICNASRRFRTAGCRIAAAPPWPAPDPPPSPPPKSGSAGGPHEAPSECGRRSAACRRGGYRHSAQQPHTARARREQRDIHAVLDADHHLLASGAGLDDDRGLYPLELPLGDADAVTLHQPVGAGRVDRQHVGVGLGHPTQVAHCLVREIGIVLTVGVADARQEVVLGKETLHPVDLAFGSMDEDVVVEQRPIRADQLAVTLVHLDIRRGKELKAGLSVTHPAIELLLQRAGRISLVMPVPGDRENQHIPTHGLAVLFGPKSAGDRIGPVPGVFAQKCHVQRRKVLRPKLSPEGNTRPCR